MSAGRKYTLVLAALIAHRNAKRAFSNAMNKTVAVVTCKSYNSTLWQYIAHGAFIFVAQHWSNRISRINAMLRMRHNACR
jgi:hypothetical protein